jgi:hypothetical protein
MSKRSQLTASQKEKFAEKLMDWGNLVFIGLVLFDRIWYYEEERKIIWNHYF